MRIPNVNVDGVAETNDRYQSLAADLNTENQQVVAASADVGFRPSTPGLVRDTYDAAHPSSRGELKIAAAVADALSVLGVGARYPRPLPGAPLGPRRGALVRGTAGNHSLTLRWTSAPGTTGEIVWSRDLTAGRRWKVRSGVVDTGSFRLKGLVNGHRYRCRVRPVKVWARASDTSSNLVTLRPHRP